MLRQEGGISPIRETWTRLLKFGRVEGLAQLACSNRSYDRAANVVAHLSNLDWYRAPLPKGLELGGAAQIPTIDCRAQAASAATSR